jgi:hypothetical protein
MKKTHLKSGFLLLFLCAITAMHAQNLYVKNTSGVQTTFAISNIQKITFSSGNLSIIKISGIENTYSLANTRFLNFVNTSPVTSLTGLDKENNNILAYPNPFNSEVNIELNDFGKQPILITILSLDGRVVYNEKLQNITSIHKINLSQLPKGSYLCRLSNSSDIKTIKFLKQ